MTAPAAPWRAAAGLPLAVALLALVTACSSSGGGRVVVGDVRRADVTEVVQAPATVAPRAGATLNATAAGTLRRLLVHDGQAVHAGQVLAVVDSPAARADLVRARRAVAQAGSAGTGGGPVLSLGSDAAAQRAFARADAAAASVPDARARQAAAAGVAQARAQYVAARSQAAALLAALQRGLGSAARVGTAVAGAQRAQAQVQLLAAQRTVDGLTLVAPLSGVVSLGSTSAPAGGGADLLAQLPESLRSAVGAAGGSAAPTSSSAGGASGGELAEGVPVAAGAPLLSVTDTSQLSLTAEVDETEVLQVRPGIPATAELDALPGSSYDAVVDSVGMTPTTSARGGVTYPVRLRLGAGTGVDGAPAPRPRPGMSAVVSLRLRQDRDALSVPATAVVRDGPRDTVYVVRDGRVHRREVVLGAQGDLLVAVTSGLDAGDRVVVRGADTLRDGQRVPR